MKLSVSLLFFLQLASSAPIPDSAPTSSLSTPSPADCVYLTCNPTILRLLRKPSPPPHSQPWESRPSSSRDLEDAAFDNSPRTPSHNTPASVALSSINPLTSSYLQSIGTQRTFTGPKAAKPTSSLPSLRKEDLIRYWKGEERRGQGLDSVPKQDAEILEQSQIPDSEGNMLLPGNIYIKTHYASQGQDILIVVIVLLFLALVIAVEGAEKIRDFGIYVSKTYIFKSTKRGEIYLDDKAAWSNNRQMSIQADPTFTIIQEKDGVIIRFSNV